MMRTAALLVGTTAAMVGITTLLYEFAPRSDLLETVTSCWLVATIFFTPFWVVPLHFRWQKPRESSAALAFVTGIPAWLISAAHAIYTNMMTFGL